MTYSREPRAMFHDSLSEKDRRRYAAIEGQAGHGGIEYVADVLGCDPKTIARST